MTEETPGEFKQRIGRINRAFMDRDEKRWTMVTFPVVPWYKRILRIRSASSCLPLCQEWFHKEGRPITEVSCHFCGMIGERC